MPTLDELIAIINRDGGIVNLPVPEPPEPRPQMPGELHNRYQRTRHKGKLTYYHRDLAEWRLGRKLKSGEVCHHKDGDTYNNHPSNLMVFSSHSLHRRFEEWEKQRAQHMFDFADFALCSGEYMIDLGNFSDTENT